VLSDVFIRINQSLRVNGISKEFAYCVANSSTVNTSAAFGGMRGATSRIAKPCASGLL